MHATRVKPIWRIAVVLIGLPVCAWLMWNATRVGASRLLSNYGAGAELAEPTNESVRFAAKDPEAYASRARVFLNAGEAATAATDFERAISLRPNDYQLWMELGNAQDQAGNAAGAVTVFAEAVRIAPHYAHTRWQYGNLLLRVGRYEQAFAELRRAGISDPMLAPQVIDLTWGIYQGDASAVEAVIQPQTSAARMALAIYFAQHGKGTDAMRLFRESRRSSDQERQSLLTALLTSKQFAAAYEVWSNNRDAGKPDNRNPVASMIDGSFEGEIGLGDSGFGWQLNAEANAGSETNVVGLSLDSAAPSHGARSLLINWSGNPPTTKDVVSQLVLVEPMKRYQLSFDGRTQNLVTASAPAISVLDANAPSEALMQSEPLPQGTTGWRKFTLSFETGATTSAILITLQRQNCPMPLCPIFGQTWFDNFVMQ